MPRLLIHFTRYGPYHHARLRSAAEVVSPLGWEVSGLEVAGSDTTYAWRPAVEAEINSPDSPSVVSVFPQRNLEGISRKDIRSGIRSQLNALQPDVIAIAGWGSLDARVCQSWARSNNRLSIVMSETREVDGKRIWWRECLKSRFVRRFDAALVGARSHRDYLVKLGIPANRIAMGYNVVDNKYFASEAARWKAEDLTLVHPYFLASNRFIERKNLSHLIDAYARYAKSSSEFPTNDKGSGTIAPNPWPLCLLGDGELKGHLLAHARKLGLTVLERAPWEPPTKNEYAQRIDGAQRNQQRRTKNGPEVYLPGFRQIDELPRFYAHAGCFVHPALEEPWGLVINEAMACGLPVISGNNVGAAEELVEGCRNGCTFDANDVYEIAATLSRVASLSDDERHTMASSSRSILEERCPTDAFGIGLEKLISMFQRP